MNNKEYTDRVAANNFPKEIIVPLDPPFEDVRGKIQNLVLSPITSIAIITSKAGTVRSNHYHNENWHYLYIVSGSMEYYERDVGASGGNIPPVVVRAGEMVFTGPMKVHKTIFLEDTIMMSFGAGTKDHKHHEEDLVRVEF
jgi:quercetin dioxygenase-like cupin family protein